ncbi:hypothetical protein ACFYRD_36670 [Streptomyces hirsutus]|uniref:hypothetical protein n=1 Tax=Streptomyces hirsutus TaxID=35620 RepID=UPI0033A09DE3
MPPPPAVLGLRSGCCPDPDEPGWRHVIHGYVYKTAVDEAGNPLSTGELRDVPWATIAPVVSAIRVLERIAPVGELLFGSQFHQFGFFSHPTKVALRAETLRERMEHFVDWASELALRLDRPHEMIPPDPHGAIGTGRFRRTLAWHIARRPGGLIALAIQYGHMRTAVSAGYPNPRELHQMDYNPALRQLGNRLVGTLHGCLKTRTPYHESTAWSHQATLSATT